MTIKSLHLTPQKATKLLAKAGIRRKSDLGAKLSNIALQKSDKVEIKLTQRQQPQLLLPIALTKLSNMSENLLDELLSGHEREVVKEWTKKRLSDDDYEELVDIIQDMDQEVFPFLIADSDAMEAIENDLV